MYQALYRKYRPKTFTDVSGQNHITEILKNQVKTDRVSHAYIFTGTRGTGKTSCAKILAKAVNCLNPEDGNPCNICDACLSINRESSLDVLEIDAASNNKVDDIRGLLEETKYTPASLKKRVYIIDEVHMLTTQAFNALLKTLEEPPAHVLFILATTEIHKVLPTILSRCQRFDFKRITSIDIEDRLEYVANLENFTIEKDALKIIAKLAEGGMRDALSILDRCITSDENTITAELVCDRVGNISFSGLIDLAKCIKTSDTLGAITKLDELYNDGIEIVTLTKQLLGLYRDILIAKVTSDNTYHLMYGVSEQDFMELFVANDSLEHYIKIISNTLLILGKSVSKKVDVEICLITLCKPLNTSDTPIEKRMAELEDKISNYKPMVVEKTVEVSKKQEVTTEKLEKLSILDVAGETDDNLVSKLLTRVKGELQMHIIMMIKKSKIFFNQNKINIVVSDNNIYDTLNQDRLSIAKSFSTVFKENIEVNILNSKNRKLNVKKDGENSIEHLLNKLKNENIEITEE